MISKRQLIQKGSETKQESKYVDFKEEFNITSNKDWCEIIKDIVAMANSGGGIIIFGVKNNGKKSNKDSRAILSYDSADIVNRINKYTGCHFSEFDVLEIKRNKSSLAALIIAGIYPPLIFIKPGTYLITETKQNTAFSQGTLYVRHGSKSEPATSSDLELILKREIKKRRSNWLGNIRKVMEGPTDLVIFKNQPNTQLKKATLSQTIQITSDKNAPSLRINEESIFNKIFKNDSKKVVERCHKIFSNFKQNKKFYGILKTLKQDQTVYKVRYLNIDNPRGGKKGYYSDKIFEKLRSYYKNK